MKTILVPFFLDLFVEVIRAVIKRKLGRKQLPEKQEVKKNG